MTPTNTIVCSPSSSTKTNKNKQKDVHQDQAQDHDQGSRSSRTMLGKPSPQANPSRSRRRRRRKKKEKKQQLTSPQLIIIMLANKKKKKKKKGSPAHHATKASDPGSMSSPQVTGDARIYQATHHSSRRIKKKPTSPSCHPSNKARRRGRTEELTLPHPSNKTTCCSPTIKKKIRGGGDVKATTTV